MLYQIYKFRNINMEGNKEDFQMAQQNFTQTSEVVKFNPEGKKEITKREK